MCATARQRHHNFPYTNSYLFLNLYILNTRVLMYCVVFSPIFISVFSVVIPMLQIFVKRITSTLIQNISLSYFQNVFLSAHLLSRKGVLRRLKCIQFAILSLVAITSAITRSFFLFQCSKVTTLAISIKNKRAPHPISDFQR